MKKILYITYDGLTDPLGQSQVLPYVVELGSHSYKFTILSFEKKARLAKEKHIIEEITKRAGIEWVPLTFTKRPPVLSKIYDRWKLKRKSHQLFKKHRFDLIHCRSYVAAEIGLWLKKKYGVRFLFDMRGFWADEKIDNGQWNMKNLLFRKIYAHYKKKEKQFLRDADGIVSLTHTAKKELVNRFSGDLVIDVIPCCADLAHFNYKGESMNGMVEGLREQIGINKNNKVITYLGSVGGWYMTKEMFSFYKALLKKYPEFILTIITKDNPAIVKKEAEESGLPVEKLRIFYSGRKELPDYLSLSDCSIFFIRPTYSKMATSPTKHGELMGMGVPVICNDIGDTGRIIEETQTGLVVKEFSEPEYDRIVQHMDDLLAIPKEKIRRSAFEFFDLKKGSDRYLQLYQRILKD
jgi:glycosyltransferase involved in cell wall biosynthesis